MRAGTFLSIYSYVQSALAYSLNTALIYLLVTVDHTYFHKYRLILFHIAILNLFISTVLVFLQQAIHAPITTHAMIVNTEGPLYQIFGTTLAGRIALSIFFSEYTAIFCVYSLSYTFAVTYRYLSLVHTKFVEKYLTMRNILLSILIIHLCGICLFISTFTGIAREMGTLEEVIAKMEPHIRFDTLFIGSNFANKRSIPIVFCISVVLVFGGFAFVLYGTVMARRYLNEKKMHFRRETLVMHRTLMNALCSQMALPMLFFAPILVHVIVTFFWDPPIFLDYQVYSLIGWQPVIDPLITIYSVIPYRKSAIKFFLQPIIMERRRKLKRSTVCITESRNLATEMDDGCTTRKPNSAIPVESVARS